MHTVSLSPTLLSCLRRGACCLLVALACVVAHAQSMSDEVLREAGRGHRAADTAEAARRVKAHGFELILQMMVGLPGSTAEDERQTARQLAALGPDGVRIYPTCVLAHTPLYDLYRRDVGILHLAHEQYDARLVGHEVELLCPDIHIAGQYIVRWTSVLTQRFDTTAFKKVMPDVYKEYTKQVSSRRFSIA